MKNPREKLICYFAKIMCGEPSFLLLEGTPREFMEGEYFPPSHSIRHIAEKVTSQCAKNSVDDRTIDKFKKTVNSNFDLKNPKLDYFIKEFEYGFTEGEDLEFDDYEHYKSTLTSVVDELFPKNIKELFDRC